MPAMAPNDMTLPSGTKATEDLLPLAKQLGVDPVRPSCDAASCAATL